MFVVVVFLKNMKKFEIKSNKKHYWRAWIYEIRKKAYKIIDKIVENWDYKDFLIESIKILNEYWSNRHCRPIKFKNYKIFLIRKDFLFFKISKKYEHKSTWLFDEELFVYSDYIDHFQKFTVKSVLRWKVEKLYHLDEFKEKKKLSIKEILTETKKIIKNDFKNSYFLNKT